MVRALETVETFAYTYRVDGELITEGKATLVRIMADEESASVLVNGCMFLNVSSFQYLNFHTDVQGQSRIELFIEGAVLEVTPLDEPEIRGNQRQVIRLMEESVFGASSIVSLDDDDDED
jgi:capsular polysaccharide biosynthesis protein